MSHSICKLDGMYFEWSTIVDAPVTYGLSLKEFKTYYRKEYGREGMRNLDARLKRVEIHGTSSLEGDVDDVIAINRAGPDECELTRKGLIKFLKERKG